MFQKRSKKIEQKESIPLRLTKIELVLCRCLFIFEKIFKKY